MCLLPKPYAGRPMSQLAEVVIRLIYRRVLSAGECVANVIRRVRKPLHVLGSARIRYKGHHSPRHINCRSAPQVPKLSWPAKVNILHHGCLATRASTIITDRIDAVTLRLRSTLCIGLVASRNRGYLYLSGSAISARISSPAAHSSRRPALSEHAACISIAPNFCF